MSSINSLASALNTATSATSTSPGSTSSSSASSPSNTLTANDFIQFMITQLQNQDPLDPTDSNQMLTQMSEIGQLESATNLQSSLTTMVQQNQIASASGMIGKYIQGTDQSQNQVSGSVTAVQVTTNGVNLTIDSGDTVPLNNVTSITNSKPASATGAAGTAATTSTPATGTTTNSNVSSAAAALLAALQSSSS
jgi:flagellar basal-body rod modification protein FlgD